MQQFGIQKILMAAVVLAGALVAQPRRPPETRPIEMQDWWTRPVVVKGLNLSEAQTKQLNAIQASYVDRLMVLKVAMHTAETNLDNMFNQAAPDDWKAEAVIDQYAHAREDLTRTLTKLTLQMRNVLTAEQWQQLQDRDGGRGGPGPGQGRGWKGTSRGSTVNKAGPAASQK